MPLLAIPYVVPFANAAGIVIGSVATAVGLSALSDKVQDYMQEFPEESMKILAMIMPEQGIAALFNKEAGDDDELDEKEAVKGREEEVDFDEEVEVKDTRTKKEIVLDAVRKAKRGKGNYASPDAEGNWVSGRGSVIRGLEDAGKVDKGLSKKPYKKSKFNWKRFTRKKADGGRIGFEVGGLSDRAQGIYDSWIAAGHTEADVLAYLTAQGLYNAGGEEATGIETIVNADINQGGGGGDFKGGGKWGNLDLSKTKTFNKNVFKTEGPVKGWDMSEIEGFYDPTQGNWKTFEGKNIEHGGYFTGEPKEGDIEGTPIDWGNIPTGLWGLGMKGIKGIQNAWNEKQAANVIEAAAKRQAKSIELHKAKVAQDAQDALAASYTGPPTSNWNPGQHERSGGKSYSGKDGSGSGPEGGSYGVWGADGGLATMFQRRR